MPKDNFRDRLDGNELDLSLSNLSVVPVKEMVFTGTGLIFFFLSNNKFGHTRGRTYYIIRLWPMFLILYLCDYNR